MDGYSLETAISQFERDGFKDGDIISHDWVKWALNIPEPKSIKEARDIEFLKLSRFENFRDTLLTKKNIALRNIKARGYLVVPPRQQAEYAISEAVKGFSKVIIKTDKLLTNCRIDALTNDERRRHMDARVKFDGINGILKRQRKDVFALFAPKKE